MWNDIIVLKSSLSFCGMRLCDRCVTACDVILNFNPKFKKYKNKNKIVRKMKKLSLLSLILILFLSNIYLIIYYIGICILKFSKVLDFLIMANVRIKNSRLISFLFLFFYLSLSYF